MDYTQRQLVSLHEAGHAVAAVALGGRVETVSMSQAKRAESPALDPWSAAVFCLSGAVAARMLGPAARSPHREHSPHDLAAAAAVLGREQLGSDVVATLEREARVVVGANDRWVRRVAEGIREAGTLSGAQVERIMAGEAVAAVLAATARQHVPTGTSAAFPGRPHRAAPAADEVTEAGRLHGTDPSGRWPMMGGKVLVLPKDHAAVAEAFGLTLEGLEALQAWGLPDGRYGTSWVRVRPQDNASGADSW